MYTAKRPRSVPKRDLNNDLKGACSATKAAQRIGHEEPSAKRFIPNPSAIITTTPLVFVFTMLSVMGYWRLLPDVPETVKAFVSNPRLRATTTDASKESSVARQGTGRSGLPIGKSRLKSEATQVKKSLSCV